MSEPTKLYYQLREGKREHIVNLKLTAEELELLDKIADGPPGNRKEGPKVGRSEILRWGLYKVLDEHGFGIWE